MAAKLLTITELRKAGMITSVEIVAAIDAYVTDSVTGLHRFASRPTVEIAKGIKALIQFAEMVTRPGSKEKTFRTVVTTIA